MLRYGISIVAAWTAVAAAQNLPGMAAGILEQTGLARQEIGDQNAPGAIDHVRQAITLAKSIQEQTSGQAKPVLIAVEQRAAEIRSAKLDVSSAADRLETARIALDRQDWAAADNALSAISKSLIRTKAEGDMPLLKVRQNLQLAKARVLEDKYKEAAAPLRAAAEGLAQYQLLFPGPRAETRKRCARRSRPMPAISPGTTYVPPIRSTTGCNPYSSGTRLFSSKRYALK